MSMIILTVLFVVGIVFICCFENNRPCRDHEAEFEEAYTKALDAAMRKHMSQ